MRNLLAATVIVGALSWTAVASADAMPACPDGQHLEENPTSPGAQHHGG